MTGIAGILGLDGAPAARADLRAMARALGSARAIPSRAKGPAGLAGSQLAPRRPADPAAGPPAGRPELAFTGRIDNRVELAAELAAELDGARHSDGQLVLAAHCRFGDRCVERLEGDFAFAIWDPGQGRLFCARDALGVLPLYYHAARDRFAFASRLDALLCLPGLPRELDRTRVADFIARHHDPVQGTFYRAVRRLPPGHTLAVSDGPPLLRCYWRPEAGAAGPRSERECVEAFGATLDRAVRARLRGQAGAVGAMLSGGLDSSSLVCLARRALSGRTLHTFSAVFASAPPAEARAIDERDHVAAVVAGGGLHAHELHADRLSPLLGLERELRARAEPFDGPNMYLHLAAFERAAQLGLRAMLDGSGGDDVVSHGLELLPWLAVTGRWTALHRELAALARRHRTTTWRLLRQLVLRPLLPPALLRARARLLGRTQPFDRLALVAPELARDSAVRERWLAARRNGWPRPLRREQAEGLRSPLLGYAFEGVHHEAASFGIQPLYPFFDRRLVELCLSLPPEQSLHRGWDRVVMRRALEGLLPPAVQWRAGKARLASNFLRQLWQRERHRLAATVRDERGLLTPFVDRPALLACYERYSAAPLRASEEAQALYGLVQLASWLASRPNPA
jgi:asparagine synthase (glutamine-hydrolysing)